MGRETSASRQPCTGSGPLAQAPSLGSGVASGASWSPLRVRLPQHAVARQLTTCRVRRFRFPSTAGTAGGRTHQHGVAHMLHVHAHVVCSSSMFRWNQVCIRPASTKHKSRVTRACQARLSIARLPKLAVQFDAACHTSMPCASCLVPRASCLVPGASCLLLSPRKAL